MAADGKNPRIPTPCAWVRTGEYFDTEAPIADQRPGVCDKCSVTPIRHLFEVVSDDDSGRRVAWFCFACATPFEMEARRG